MKLSDPLSELPGVGEHLSGLFAQVGVTTLEDLLIYLPHRLENRSNLKLISRLGFDEEAVIQARVENISSRTSKRGVLIIQASVSDTSGKINALWFNQRYLFTFLKPGQEVFLYGRKQLSRPLGHPFMVKKIIAQPEVAPIYPTTAGLHQGYFRKIFQRTPILFDEVVETLNPALREEFDLKNKSETLRAAHFPQQDEDLVAAQRYLAIEELLRLALQIHQARRQRKATQSSAVTVNEEILKNIVQALPFELTTGQRKVAWEIIKDIASDLPMRRLLYGEVGSGKTMVAVLASASVLASKQKVILLAPTTALAHQHQQSLHQILTPLDYRVGLMTGEQKSDHESSDILVGTHALLYRHDFRDIGLLIIDEQHRFGVAERQALLDRHPHTNVLMMTATPIPRSLAQTIFGQLDISYLRDKPRHQQPVETVYFTERDRAKIEEQIEQRLNRGEPGYVICPRIATEGSATKDTLFNLERKTVLKEEKRLKARFKQARVASLHGRFDEQKKQQIITDFRDGKIDILVCTTVVEVGIDNPDATWILIEEANSFGLSQLHQLRGRVGRGKRASVCYLADTETTPIGTERLRALCQTTDGLELAEIDLQLRGPGELIGYEQSGLPPLRYADWRDTELITRVFAIASQLTEDKIKESPELTYLMRQDGQRKIQFSL